MSDSEQTFQNARAAWRAALREHVLAPPDAGFSARLAGLAAAAAERARACEEAYRDGFEWPAARGAAKPPYELQPGSGRRGPENLCERFDKALAELDRVSEGGSMRAVGRAYQEVAETVVERLDRASGLLSAGTSKRRRSA